MNSCIHQNKFYANGIDIWVTKGQKVIIFRRCPRFG